MLKAGTRDAGRGTRKVKGKKLWCKNIWHAFKVMIAFRVPRPASRVPRPEICASMSKYV